MHRCPARSCRSAARSDRPCASITTSSAWRSTGRPTGATPLSSPVLTGARRDRTPRAPHPQPQRGRGGPRFSGCAAEVWRLREATRVPKVLLRSKPRNGQRGASRHGVATYLPSAPTGSSPWRKWCAARSRAEIVDERPCRRRGASLALHPSGLRAPLSGSALHPHADPLAVAGRRHCRRAQAQPCLGHRA